MDDQPVNPSNLIKSRMEALLALLVQDDHSLPAAWMAMAVEAMPTNDI